MGCPTGGRTNDYSGFLLIDIVPWRMSILAGREAYHTGARSCFQASRTHAALQLWRHKWSIAVVNCTG
jgi:hypothetical protein